MLGDMNILMTFLHVHSTVYFPTVLQAVLDTKMWVCELQFHWALASVFLQLFTEIWFRAIVYRHRILSVSVQEFCLLIISACLFTTVLETTKD